MSSFEQPNASLVDAEKAGGFIPFFLSAFFVVGGGLATAATASPLRSIDQGEAPPKSSVQQGTVPPGQVVKPVPPQQSVLEPLPGMTFADQGTIYVPARMLASRLSLDVEFNEKKNTITIGGQEFGDIHGLFAGDALIPIREITKFGATLEPVADQSKFTVQSNVYKFDITIGLKRIEVDKALQQLTAFQGDMVVLKTNISTGRPGHGTPNGDFLSGPKERMHYSHKYNDAEMPYAVQVHGDVFLHGYSSVPSYPASHGCVRIPLGRKSPAKYLFGWVNRGIEVKIFGTYDWNVRRTKRKHRKH
ncbi:MAG: L,D-transpeptidase family protein [Armatimonadota bacterium]